MAFTDEIFPESISYGARGGLSKWKSKVIETNGSEQRYQKRTSPKGRWSVGLDLMDPSEFWEIYRFHIAMRGMVHTFLFKDWNDYKGRMIATEEHPVFFTVDASPMPATAQLLKPYDTIGVANVFNKNIKRLKTGTIEIYNDTTLLTETTDYTVNLTTGLVTWQGGYEGDVIVNDELKWDGEFYFHCRFGIDDFDPIIEFFELNGWASIPIVEVLE
jgi:uncharacterized protein (TIGR02217 family)